MDQDEFSDQVEQSEYAEPIDPVQNLPTQPGHSSFGRLERVLRRGDFAITAELAPPDSADPEEVFKAVAHFDGWVDGINATDGSGAHCHMASMAVCALLTRRGYAPILQISCRDYNRISIQGNILGASALGVNNILCLSGDGVATGDHPEAKPVFDLDCMSLLRTAATLRDKKQFLSGRKLTYPPHVFLGAAINPFAPPLDYRPLRLAKKIEAGAQFVQSQYCYDLERLKIYMERVRDLGLDKKCHILVGVGPLASARTARWMASNVPGVHIPEAVIARLEGAEKQKVEGRNLCIEFIQQIHEIEGVSGIHLMAYRQEEWVAEIVERSGILSERRPWSLPRQIEDVSAKPQP